MTDTAGVTSGLGQPLLPRGEWRGGEHRGERVDGGDRCVRSPSTVAPLDRSPHRRTARLGARTRRGARPTSARSGRAIVRGEEVDRFELALGDLAERAARSGAPAYLHGYSAGDRLGPAGRIASGSRHGAFTWSPGVGFVGTYDLVFVREPNGAPCATQEVRFILGAEGSGHVGAQVVIDTPREQAEVAQPFMLAGWAADRDAVAGTGIDRCTSWAYPSAAARRCFWARRARGGRGQTSPRCWANPSATPGGG